MSIILPYKDLKNIEGAKFMLPNGELLITSSNHEEFAKSYLFWDEFHRKILLEGKHDDFFPNLSHEECEKLRKYYKDRVQQGSINPFAISQGIFNYLFTDFMVKELKVDMINPTQNDMYSNISNIKSGSPVIFKRF